MVAWARRNRTARSADPDTPLPTLRLLASGRFQTGVCRHRFADRRAAALRQPASDASRREFKLTHCRNFAYGMFRFEIIVPPDPISLEASSSWTACQRLAR
jgi:hypothetical protein